MAITSTQATQSEPPTPPNRQWRKPLAGIAAAVVLALGAGWGAYSLAKSPSNNSTAITPAAAVTSLQNGCSQWLAQSGLNLGSTQRETGWCQGMGDWMREHMSATGMAPLMWGNSDELRATCRSWAAGDAPVSPGAEHSDEWCDSMASWMNQHMRDWSGSDSWDSWMGPMMHSMMGTRD
jgi:hypothetical protein